MNTRDAFHLEAGSLLDRLETALLHLERAPYAHLELEEAFRAAHTLKGSAVVVDAIEVEWFAHVMENVLDRVRQRSLAVSPHVVTTLLACGDHLRFLIGLSALDEPTPDFAQEDRARLIGELVPYLGGEVPPVEADARPESHWLLSVRFSHDIMRQGMDPADFLRYLGSLGRIVALRIDDSALPAAADYAPELCYLRFELELESAADKQAIEDVFACARESCELRIHPPQRLIHDYAAHLRALPDNELRMGEMLVRVGALTAEELAGALRAQRGGIEPSARPIGSILVDEGYVPPELVQLAASRQAEIRERMAQESRSAKVPLAELDELIGRLDKLAGELQRDGVARELSAQAANALALARGLRDVRVADCFARLQRSVRDLAAELGKEIDLTLFGSELNLDRALAEALSQIVLHLVRNAIDHGIEAPEARLAAGKPRRGSLHLSLDAGPDGLTLELADDGRGIDSARLLHVARVKGLVDATAQPTREDLLALVFTTGFSTRETADRVSGRGVGLDAVAEGVRALAGDIQLSSEPGRGTRVVIRLPARRPLTDTHPARRSA